MASSRLFGVLWEMRPGESAFSGSFIPTKETRQYEEMDNGYKLTVEGTHNGKPYSWGYTAQYDGKPHAVHGRTDVDSIIAYRVNDRVTFGVFQKGGVEGGSYARGVSEDGKRLTVQAGGIDDKGKPYFDVIRYSV